MKYIYYIVWFILMLVFSIFIENTFWVWAYLDSWFVLFKWEWFNFLNSISQITYFWYDESPILGMRWIWYVFANYLPIFFVYFIYFIANYYFSYQILKNNFGSQSAKLWALFFTINPVSLFFLNQIGFIFAYTSIVIIIYGFIEYLKHSYFRHLFIIIIWFLFLTSYTRITWIYGIFLIWLWIISYKHIYNFILENPRKTVIHAVLVILALAPFLFAVLWGHIVWDKEYFSWISNYSDSSISWWDNLYKSINSSDAIKWFSITEPTRNYLEKYHNNMFFLIFTSLFTILIIIKSAVSKNLNKYIFYILWVLIWSIFLRFSGKFLSQENFVNLNYKFFPFLTNNTNWILLLYIVTIAYLISFCFNKLDAYEKKTWKTLIYLFIIINILPLILQWNNDKLWLIKTWDFSPVYQEYIFWSDNKNEASILYPDYKIYNSQSPYFIYYHYNKNNKLTLSNNSRFITGKQAELSKAIQKNTDNVENNSILNVKNILIFNEVDKAEKNQFDYYTNIDYSSKIKKYNDIILTNTSFKDESKYKDISYFSHKESTNYEYFIYSPQSVEEIELDDFYKQEIDVTNRPVIVDSISFHKPEKLNSFELADSNKNIRIDYKKSTINPTKYFLKLSDVDTTESFLLQLNQTFGMSWKLKWGDQEEFYRYKCLEDYKYFPITNNSFCHIQDGYLDSVKDYRYFNNQAVKESNHFEWNFVGNTWLVEPDDIRNKDQWSSDLYAIIIYEKQFWYIMSILISIWTLWLLLLLTIIQELYFHTKKWKKEKTYSQ